jgi:hypothetical protein
MSFQLPAPRERQTRGAKRKAKMQIVSEFKGREQRLVKKTFPSGHVFHYVGPRGQERKALVDLPTGNAHFLKGRKGQERVVRVEQHHPSGKGNVYHYAVIDGRNSWTRCELPNGCVEHFRRVKCNPEKGMKFVIARSHFVHSDGCVTHYEGDRLYHERRVRYEVPSESATRPEDWPHGFVLHYEGESHEERLVRKEVPEGEVSVDWADGRKSTINDNGDIDATTYPNGKVAHYARTGPDDIHSLWCVDHPDGRIDYFENYTTDVNLSQDAPWNVREDCVDQEHLAERTFPNGDRHYFCPYNDNRITHIHRAVEGRPVPIRPAQVLWYRVREWFKRRTIVLHWQEQTQMRLYGPSGAGRLADRAAFASDFVN